MSDHPFTSDGVQAISCHAPGWTWQPEVNIFTTARAAERWVDGQVAHWLSYTDDIQFSYYGYDPRVLADDGSVIGTDGYPDAQGLYDTETETVRWERA